MSFEMGNLDGMSRWFVFAALLVACGSSSSSPSPVADAGMDADTSDPGGDFEEPLPECIPTSIGIWDDFEEPLDASAQLTAAIAFDPLHHCGAQGLKATVAAGEARPLFVRSVPAIATPTKAVSWSFLVQFALPSSDPTFRFAELLLANDRRLVFEFAKGSLSLVERDDAAATETMHANLATLALNEWQRIDVRLEYPTKKATLKIGPPGGTAPTQELVLVSELDRVTAEQLGPTPPDAGAVTVHYDRAAVYVE